MWLTLFFFTATIESNYDETTDSFDAMALKAELLRGVYAYGFERPSAIQQRAIMPVIKGKSNEHFSLRKAAGWKAKADLTMWHRYLYNFSQAAM